MKATLIVFTIAHLLCVPLGSAKPTSHPSGLRWNESHQPAINMLRQRDYQGAAEAARRLIAKSPKDNSAHCILGRAAMHLKKKTMAMKHLNRAIELQPNYPNPYFFRALTLADGQASKGAIRDFKKATELAPNDVAYWVEFSRFYTRIGEDDAAAATMEMAKAVSPKNRMGWYRLGEHYWRNGDPKNASDAWNKGLDMPPKRRRSKMYLGARFRMGQYHQTMGDLENAIAQYNAILEVRPHHTLVLERMIQLHNQQGLYAEAKVFRTRYEEQRAREIMVEQSKVSRTPQKIRRTPVRTFRVDQFRVGAYDIVTSEFVHRRSNEAIYTFLLNRMGSTTEVITLEADPEKGTGFRLVHRDNQVSVKIGMGGINTPPPPPPPIDPGQTLKAYSEQPTYPEIKRDVIEALQKRR